MSKNLVARYQQKILRTKRSLSKLEHERDTLTVTLSKLNANYTEGVLDYSDYAALYSKYLNGRSIEEWESNYKLSETRLNSELRRLEDQVAGLTESRTKSKLQVAITLTFISLLVSAFGLFAGLDGGGITGAVASAESVIPATATIEIYFAVAASQNLSNGIEFGAIEISSLNNNATDNYNHNGTNSSTYLDLSPDSNVNADFCLSANTDLKNGTSSIIPLSNFRFANATTTTINLPSQDDAISVTTSYQLANRNVAPGGKEYFRFWLDIPSDTAPLTYNNTLTFGAVQTGSTCPE